MTSQQCDVFNMFLTHLDMYTALLGLPYDKTHSRCRYKKFSCQQGIA